MINADIPGQIRHDVKAQIDTIIYWAIENQIISRMNMGNDISDVPFRQSFNHIRHAVCNQTYPIQTYIFISLVKL